MKPIALVAALLLVSCGGGGVSHPSFPEPVPHGIPLVSNGFVNWWDYDETPGHYFGVVNATGQPIVALDVVGAGLETTFPLWVEAGEIWLDLTDSVDPGFYLLRAYGANGRVYSRYFRYDAAGADAAYVSNDNLDFGL